MALRSRGVRQAAYNWRLISCTAATWHQADMEMEELSQQLAYKSFTGSLYSRPDVLVKIVPTKNWVQQHHGNEHGCEARDSN